MTIKADEYIKMGSDDNMSIRTKVPYHLILTIVNTGYFDQVMEAAKAAGATGGTVIHARGLGSEEAVKYLGITIQPEKDVVLILTEQEKRHAIMENITREAGLNTKGKGICFSLPVNSQGKYGYKIWMNYKNDTKAMQISTIEIPIVLFKI